MPETLYQILGRHQARPLPERKPGWLKVRAPGGPGYLHLKSLMRELNLHTVCEEARCPNVGECWEHGTATFMILGDVCTRNCPYGAVAPGRPPAFDRASPRVWRTPPRGWVCAIWSSRRWIATTCRTSVRGHSPRRSGRCTSARRGVRWRCWFPTSRRSEEHTS